MFKEVELYEFIFSVSCEAVSLECDGSCAGG